ncbi:DUF4880 domain-containing protein [Rhodopseudomonas pseudopalustris]
MSCAPDAAQRAALAAWCAADPGHRYSVGAARAALRLTTARRW